MQQRHAGERRRSSSCRGRAAAAALSVMAWRALLDDVDVAFIERPTRSGCAASSFGSSAMRTGRRWTTLIQLPVAFCAGISAKAEPVPPEKPATRPWNTTSLAIEVGGQLDRLAEADLLELHFLEVGVDIDAADRDDGHQRRARLRPAGRPGPGAW